MKNFTKVLLACAVITGWANQSVAQYDITTNVLNSPTANATVNTVLETPFDIRFTNNGPGTIPASTQVEIIVKVNGTPLGSPITGFSIPAAGMAPAADLGFAPGSTSIRFNVPPSSGTINVCYEVVVVGNSDPNSSNNEVCATYNVDPGTTVDLAMSNLGIVFPSVSPGGTVGGNNEVVLEMEVTITNEGDFTYPSGFALPYSLEVEGQTPLSVTGVLAADLAPNASTVRAITNTAIIPTLPAGGPFRMCATAMISNDVDASNNKTCTDYISAVGIEEVKNGTALSTVHFNNGNDVLSVFLSQQLKGRVSMTITSTGGQTIKNIEISANGQQKEDIDLSGISNGLYVLTISTQDGEVETQKFVAN